MTWFSRLMAVCLAVLWLPMASHCDLEHLPGLEFLACGTSVEAASHQQSDCQTDGCASVESGFYKTEERAVEAPAPLVAAVIPALLLSVPAENDFLSVVVASSVPDELPQRWQFVFRTAAPPRAPSFVS